jgi:hypothetical protein
MISYAGFVAHAADFARTLASHLRGRCQQA